MPEVFGLQFSPDGLDDLAAKVVAETIPAGTGPRLLVTANVDHIVKLRNFLEFRAAYVSAWAITADGFPVYLYNRMRRSTAPSRVTGSDLIAYVLPRLDPALHRVFIIASTEAIGDGLTQYLVGRGFSESAVATCTPPLGFERDHHYSEALAKQVGQHQATHLFIGLGAPKSEVWCHRHRDTLGDCYVLSVGAGLEFFLGYKERAPALVQKAGMEWLWRFAQEPQRLFRRYFVESWPFLLAIGSDLGQLIMETSQTLRSLTRSWYRNGI
jgi:N-acetylglucosaminyldiphosphoundecaprenol N-acetyl-beta-D-mannosaminyltransferase